MSRILDNSLKKMAVSAVKCPYVLRMSYVLY